MGDVMRGFLNAPSWKALLRPGVADVIDGMIRKNEDPIYGPPTFLIRMVAGKDRRAVGLLREVWSEHARRVSKEMRRQRYL